MNKTKIEMYDYTINPVKGLCPMACSYCYARRLYKRFRWNPEIRLEPYWWDGLTELEPSKIFIGSTIELFGDWIKPEWLTQIFGMCAAYKNHTFVFLTKQPQNLIKWSPFPENCWVGMTITDDSYGFSTALKQIDAPVKFISFEPLLGRIGFKYLDWIDWLIIGQQTPISAKTQPKIEWIQEILEAADKAGIPVFLKNNLRPILPLPQKVFCTEHPTGVRWLKQEFPKVK